MNKIYETIKEYFCDEFIFSTGSSFDGKIQMDSRKVTEGDIFFAINNGNKYIKEVLEKNPLLIICDEKKHAIEDPKVKYVSDTVKTMQELAKKYREKLGIKVIGITGSNGKTTTKDILFSVLSERYKVEKTMGNYNNHIGLPFTILNTNQETQVLILEMGMSDLGEIDLLCSIATPDYGIITNIGLSHMETLKIQENIFKAKTEMLNHIPEKAVFVSGDDEFLKKTSCQKAGYSPENDFILENFIQKNQGIEFFINGKKVSAPLNGRHNSLNIALTIGVAEKLGMDLSEIQSGLDKIELTGMRFQKEIWNGMELINDAYNASPLSMKAGLDTFCEIYKDRFKIAVLGDMLELGEDEINYHFETIKRAISSDIEKIFLFGPRMKEAFKKLSDPQERIKHFNSKSEIKIEIITLKDKGPVIFLKGSRGMALEEILN